MNFINYAEMAGLVDAGMAETEVIKTTENGANITTIYAGYPSSKTSQAQPPYAKNANGDLLTDGGTVVTTPVWKIRRSIVTENGDTTTVSTKWAEGAWDDRANLNYQYL